MIMKMKTYLFSDSWPQIQLFAFVKYDALKLNDELRLLERPEIIFFWERVLEGFV